MLYENRFSLWMIFGNQIGHSLYALGIVQFVLVIKRVYSAFLG